MALIKKGFFGNVSGKIGDVQGSRWKGRDVLQGWNSKQKKEPSNAQLANRSRMGNARTFAKDCLPLIPFQYNAREYLKIGYWASMMRDFFRNTTSIGFLDYSNSQYRNGSLPARVYDIYCIDVPTGLFQVNLYPWPVNDGSEHTYLGWLIYQIPALGLQGTCPVTIGFMPGTVYFNLPVIQSGAPIIFWLTMIADKSVKSSKTYPNNVFIP